VEPDVRIGYSTNVHPGRTLDEALAAIEQTAPRVRARLARGAVGHASAHDRGHGHSAEDRARGSANPPFDGATPLELGLWLSATAARELLEKDHAVEELAGRLSAQGIVVRSLNGFPYGHFHAERVKHAVYRPSWADAERLLYTRDLAEVMARLRLAEAANEGARDGVTEARAPARVGSAPNPRALEASISTVPIGWRPEIQAGRHGAALGAAAANLEQLVRELAALEERTGVRIHVDLEPEPGCFLDTSRDVVDFFTRVLRPRPGDPDVRRHLGVCHDVCHAAVMWEVQAEALERYRAAGIRVGRVQLSSALEARGAAEIRRLAEFVEPRYLHQTTLRSADGRVRFFDDLPDALAAVGDDDSLTARTHYHVPLAYERVGGGERAASGGANGTGNAGGTESAEVARSSGGVGTTRREVEAFLRAWPADEPLPALEVETYTWSVLPESLRPMELADGIAAELRWAHDAVAAARSTGVPARGTAR